MQIKHFEEDMKEMIKKTSKEIVEILISHGADINAKDESDITPLHYAAKNSDVQIVEFLISHGADIDAKDINDETPLHYAACKDRSETAKVLISNGADINAEDEYDRTPIECALENNCIFTYLNLAQLIRNL